MNFNLKLGISSIHGIGVFATKDIAKGEKLSGDAFPQVYQVTPEDVPEDVLGRHPRIATKGNFAYPDVRFQAYMNHSDDPNYDATTDVALKHIKAGDEITEDYRRIDGWEKVYPWLC